MKARRRWRIAIFAAALALPQVPLHAQSTPEANSGAPATDAIGPRELQNFSLPGTVTRQPDAPPSTTPANAQRSAPTSQQARPTRPAAVNDNQARPAPTNTED